MAGACAARRVKAWAAVCGAPRRSAASRWSGASGDAVGYNFVDDSIAELAEHVSQVRAEFAGGSQLQRYATVELLLQGADIAPSRAEAQLGYALTGSHIGVVVWVDSEKDVAELERAIKGSYPKPKMMILGFPSNPTAQCVELAFFERVVAKTDAAIRAQFVVP